MQTAVCRTHDEAKREIAHARLGRVDIGDGKSVARPKFLVETDVRDLVLSHLTSRGDFFRCEGEPYYLDRVDHRLYAVGPDASGLKPILAALDLEWKGQHTSAVASALATRANDPAFAPERMIHRYSYFDGVSSYIYQAPESMFRITVDAIESVPIGTDGVILISDLGSFPALADLTPHISAMRPSLGRDCTRLRTDLPLSSHLTSRWSDEADLSHDQLHQVYLSRILFMGAASIYKTWPILAITGPGGSGKSALIEVTLAFLSGQDDDDLHNLPGSEDNFEVRIFRSTMAIFDNVDRAGLDKPEKSTYADTICGLATGTKLTRRVLFTTADELSFKVRRHTFLTSGTYPFPPGQSDVMRRVLELAMSKGEASTSIDKATLIRNVLAARNAMVAEYLLRTQNIVCAHAKSNRSHKYQSLIPDYERFTLVCAEYEGSIAETEAIWTAIASTYDQTISQGNPLADAVRVWLGSSPDNVGRQIQARVLLPELKLAASYAGVDLPFKQPSQIGKHVERHERALRVIGLEYVRTRSGRDFMFRPSPAVLEECRKLYTELEAVAAKQRGASLRMDLSVPSFKPKPNTPLSPGLSKDEMDDMLEAIN